MSSSEVERIDELGLETEKELKALLVSTLRINETWHEFAAAWFCEDSDIETMNSTSKFFFVNYRNGLLSQLVLDLVNITADKTVKGAEQASLGSLIASNEGLRDCGEDRLRQLRENMRKVRKLRDNQIAHWNKDVRTGACRKARIDFISLENAVKEVNRFMQDVHEELLPKKCCRPIFDSMSRPHRVGVSAILKLVRLGEDARRQKILDGDLF
ncbi:hypothetical protein PhaeoP23_01324 [Phaeobacter piscinae]|uniref:HEPN AbiU2-like domain-containing protein n=1 Tax=Phaeobacter piscinae TaxID=1580596 RepID=A0ABN5DFA5_9RHOB|nr:hypothetical protein [Phaeobacter piscinae]ATG35473.1 hypothetical protein PhaeoP36_01324 [Phaeobacter piscinae]AUQ85993.1 hypothetical protein PhaeoP42_01324 [Phaeobacter piscinae]AUR23877.1 hypothetical protein PhaeoP23_01324 [Phaeobacter piscinae]